MERDEVYVPCLAIDKKKKTYKEYVVPMSDAMQLSAEMEINRSMGMKPRVEMTTEDGRKREYDDLLAEAVMLEPPKGVRLN